MAFGQILSGNYIIQNEPRDVRIYQKKKNDGLVNFKTLPLKVPSDRNRTPMAHLLQELVKVERHLLRLRWL